MNIQDCSPLGARKAFWLRRYLHPAYGLAVFIPVCFFLMLFLTGFWEILAVLLAAVPAFAVYLYLESRLIVIECTNPNCEKDINTNTPWQCGFKGCRNENVVRFPFIHECETCHYPPKAYICHHCNGVIYLTSDRQKEHAARRLDSAKPAPADTVRDPAKDNVTRQANELREAQHELAMARLKKDIEITKNKPARPPSPTTEIQAMIERIRKGVEGGKALIDLEAQLLNEARAEYANDEDKLKDMEQAIRQEIFREKDRQSGGL